MLQRGDRPGRLHHNLTASLSKFMGGSVRVVRCAMSCALCGEISVHAGHQLLMMWDDAGLFFYANVGHLWSFFHR